MFWLSEPDRPEARQPVLRPVKGSPSCFWKDGSASVFLCAGRICAFTDKPVCGPQPSRPDGSIRPSHGNPYPWGTGQKNPCPGVMIHRDRLDQALADQAVEARACLKTGFQVQTRAGGKVLAQGSEGDVSVSCRVIIGADGPCSQVGRWMAAVTKNFEGGPILGFPQQTPGPHPNLFPPLYQRGIWLAFSQRGYGQCRNWNGS